MNIFNDKILFDISDDLTINVVTSTIFGKAIVIDNFYKNPYEVREFALSSNAQLTDFFPKSNGNGNKYIDARIQHVNTTANLRPSPNCLFICNTIKQHFFVDIDPIEMSKVIAFNYFKSLSQIDPKYQLHPHKDNYDFASVVYLDKTNSGGTNMYFGECIPDCLPPSDDWEGLFPIDRYYREWCLLDSVFNRCVIYQGTYTHGQYIKDYDLVSKEPRLTQVFFGKKYNESL